jgi:hypothetical protein
MEVLSMSKYKHFVSITKLVINDHVTVLYDITPIFQERKQRAEQYKMLTLFQNEILPYMTDEEKEILNVKIDSHDDRLNAFMNELEILTLIRAAKQQLTR